MAKQTKKKASTSAVDTKSKQLTKVIELLEVLVEQGARTHFEITNFLAQRVKPEEQALAEKGEDLEGDTAVEKIGKKADVLINQAGETVELTYDTVKAEAQKLVAIDEHTEQRGFAKAREIILSYGVTKLEEVAAEHYPTVIEKVRKAIQEWK